MQTTDVLAFADFTDVGHAWLKRNDNGVTARGSVHGAAPGVYTMWWTIWNTPEGCFVPFGCSEPDLFNPNAGLAVGFAGGGVVGPNGELHVTARLREGAAVGRFPYPEFQAVGVQLTEESLTDSRHAEVHLVLRSHGPKVRGLVGEALGSFNGACVYDPPISGSEPTYGTPGPNTCADLFFAVFPSENSP
jgi:hypothetical protein